MDLVVGHGNSKLLLPEAHQRLRTLADGSRRSVRPLFADCSRRVVEPVGSCVMLGVGRRHFLVTAGHVMERVGERSLFVGSDRRLHKVIGERLYSVPEDDAEWHTDAAIIELAKPDPKELLGCRFLRLTDVSIEEREFAATKLPATYLAIGYPASRTKIRLGEGSINQRHLAHGASSVTRSELSRLSRSPRTHMGLHYWKDLAYWDKGPVAPPDPHGLSGGALFRFGAVRNPQGWSGLVGILVEAHREPVEALIAVRMSVVVALLGTAFPELRALLPQVTLLDLGW